MAVGKSLASLVTNLREELRLNVSTSVGQNARSSMIALIQRVQETLYDEHDWPFLKAFFYKNLAAGVYLYDFPTGINDDAIEGVWVLDGTSRLKIEQGITPEHYSAYDSIADVRLAPVRRWDRRQNGQFEVWPNPVSNVTNGMIFYGKAKLAAFVADADLATLDDRLIVLHAKAERLEGKKGGVKAEQAANRRLLFLKRRTKRKSRVVLGSGASEMTGRTYGIDELRVRWP